MSASTTKGGLDLLAGVEVRASGWLGFFLAARRDWVLHLGGADPARLDQTKFYGGFRARF